MSDLGPEARALLRDSRSFDEPTEADTRRVYASVLAKVGVAVGTGAGLTAMTSSLVASPAAVLGATVMKVGAALVVAGGLATAGYVALGPSPRPAPVLPSPKVERAIAEPVPAIVPSPPSLIEQPLVEAPSPSPPRARVRPSTPPSSDRAGRAPRAAPDLEAEARLLELADADLRRGDAHAALARLAEHASKYPAGALVEEREGVRVVALCRAGREAEGRKAAARFLARSPRSALASRIRAACGTD